MAARKDDRMTGLVRMLNLLPYFSSHPNRSLMEAAADLGQSPDQLKDDLNRLWCCGLPGLFPGDLVDLDFNFSGVRVLDDQGMNRPLRLTHTEAGALLLALENLEQTPGLTDHTAVLSAAAKLRELMGQSVSAVVDAISAGETGLGDDEKRGGIEAVRRGVDTRKRIAFSYLSVNDESRSEREVSIARVFSTTEGTYVVGWDHGRDGHRNFRLDRMSDVRVLESDADPHSRQLDFDTKDPFALSRSGRKVTVYIAKHALWLAEYVPMALGAWLDDDWREATLRVASPHWLQRFVLSQGGNVKLSPTSQDYSAVAQRAEEALAAYDCPIGTKRPKLH
ncbi:WYL domain-containing protein [Staphylococcus chromogenes]|nr:WYL domain-containing protein [Staphylococcus chromogenes]